MSPVRFHLHCTPGSVVSPICDPGNSTSFPPEIRHRPFLLDLIVSLLPSLHPVSSSMPSPQKHSHPCFDKPRMYLFPVRDRVPVAVFFPWPHPPLLPKSCHWQKEQVFSFIIKLLLQ